MRGCEGGFLLRHSELLPDKNPADLQLAPHGLCVFAVCQAAVLSVQSGGTARALQPRGGNENAKTRRFGSASGQHFRHGDAGILPHPASPVLHPLLSA